ncbi:MAG: PorP/SprF family type IX secretion system membrane protein, partial [Flavobacteriales bacterium]|nr:PorP/SprF family type IX secretion system membrane protein [Flavobacteriales bacterium]
MKRRVIPTFLITLLLCGVAETVFGQFQVTYPNYMVNDYFYNPAIAGSKPINPARITIRRQWMGVVKAPQQHSLTFDGLLFQYRIGMGVGLYNQTIGPASLNLFNYSWNYRVPFSANSMLSFGVAGDIAQYVINHDLIELEDPNDPVLQNGFRRAYLPDASAGLYLYSTPLNAHKYFLGVSALHLLDTQKDLPWYENQLDAPTLKRTFYAMAGYKIKMGNKLGLEPSGVFFTDNPEKPEDFGYNINGKISWNDSLWVGVSYQAERSVTAFLSFVVGRMNITYSYEMSLSDIQQYSYATHELSLAL